MIDLDEFALCTHEEANTMIFVHTNHATKGGSPEGVLVAKASNTDILFIAVSMVSPRLVYSSCELHMAKVSTGDGSLFMNCASPSDQRRAGAFTPSPIKGFYVDVVSTFCDKGNKM